MIAVLRIHGRVKLKKEIKETLFRLKLRKKFSCILVDEKDKVRMGMVEKVREYVAYGNVSEEFIKKIKEKRGKKGKDYFCLHPPIGGFKKSTKTGVHQGGILRKHDNISKLLERML